MTNWVLEPEDEACTFAECPPGLFAFGEHLGMKSEYKTPSISGYYQADAYVVESGEYFWGGAKTAEARDALIVVPLRVLTP